MQVFSKEWFEKYQKTLLWLLNAPIIKVWFRWVMRIRLCDCKLSYKINRIEPNNFSYNGKRFGDKIEITTDFRCNEKFARRLYYAFKPLWHLAHFFDMIIANKYCNKLNLGFDTLTVYPVPGTTVDGYVRQTGTNLSWATIIGGAGADCGYNVTADWRCIDIVGGGSGFNQLTRSIYLFDTSSLTSSAVISAAKLYLYAKGKADALGITPNINIYSSNPASNTALENGDFDSLGTTAFSTAISYDDWTYDTYEEFALNANGISAISKTGITKLGARNANYDVSGTTPGSTNAAASLLNSRYAASSGTDVDPKLVITYTLTATGNFFYFI